MIKISSALGLVLTTVVLFSAQGANNNYVDIFSHKLKKIDVAGMDHDLSLRLEVKSKNGFAEPAAEVVSESGDFECKVKDRILLFSGYDAVKNIWNQSWEIKVNWQPGTDLSGCMIKVTHPSQEPAYAELYMNYGAFTTMTSNEGADESQGSQCETYEECPDDNSAGDSGPDDVDDGSGSRDDGDQL